MSKLKINNWWNDSSLRAVLNLE